MITLDDLRTMQCDGAKTVADVRGNPEEYFLEPKWDGFRLISHIFEHTIEPGRGRDVELRTRSLKSQRGKLPHVEEFLLANFPAGTVFDGEIIALKENSDGTVDNDFEHVQSVMLSLPERSVQVQEAVRPLDYLIFDCTFLAGHDLRGRPYHERRQILLMAFEGISHPNVRVTDVYPCTQGQHDAFCAQGREGSIAKHRDSKYLNDRSRGWFKLKKTYELDAVVLGFMPGSTGTKYEGKIGSIIFGQPCEDLDVISTIGPTLVPGLITLPGDGRPWFDRGSCSGLTDSLRDEINADPSAFVGRTLAVSHMGLMADGVHVRHPQFARWRDQEKSISDITWDHGDGSPIGSAR